MREGEVLNLGRICRGHSAARELCGATSPGTGSGRWDMTTLPTPRVHLDLGLAPARLRSRA